MQGDVTFVAPSGRVVRSVKELKLALGVIAGVCAPDPINFTTTLAQKFQSDPVGLLGAMLSAKWVDQTFRCRVLMYRESRESDGDGDKSFEALVEYEADRVQQ